VLPLLVLVALSVSYCPAQGSGAADRVVEGKVLDPAGSPQPNAVVYLRNQKTLEIKSYIAPADGSFRFGLLSSDVDYQIWARYQNMKSRTRSISSFDSKKHFIFDLKLEPAK
jgi:hypothetical protein